MISMVANVNAHEGPLVHKAMKSNLVVGNPANSWCEKFLTYFWLPMPVSTSAFIVRSRHKCGQMRMDSMVVAHVRLVYELLRAHWV